jgi:hypothetical protein
MCFAIKVSDSMRKLRMQAWKVIDLEEAGPPIDWQTSFDFICQL